MGRYLNLKTKCRIGPNTPTIHGNFPSYYRIMMNSTEFPPCYSRGYELCPYNDGGNSTYINAEGDIYHLCKIDYFLIFDGEHF